MALHIASGIDKGDLTGDITLDKSVLETDREYYYLSTPYTITKVQFRRIVVNVDPWSVEIHCVDLSMGPVVITDVSQLYLTLGAVKAAQAPTLDADFDAQDNLLDSKDFAISVDGAEKG